MESIGLGDPSPPTLPTEQSCRDGRVGGNLPLPDTPAWAECVEGGRHLALLPLSLNTWPRAGPQARGSQPNDLLTPVQGFPLLLWRKSEPPPSTYPPHNGSVRGVVYWPHSDMGVGNDGGTKCSQWDWEHPQVVFLAPLGVSSWCGYRWAQATAAHIGG